MLSKFFNLIILSLFMVNISIPLQVNKLLKVDTSYSISLEDFVDDDMDPTDNDSPEGAVDAEIFYLKHDLGLIVELFEQLHSGQLPTYLSVYILKLFVPPSR